MLLKEIGFQTFSWCIVLSDRRQFMKLALSCAGIKIKRCSIHMQMWHDEAMTIMLRGENRHSLPNSALSYALSFSLAGSPEGLPGGTGEAPEKVLR